MSAIRVFGKWLVVGTMLFGGIGLPASAIVDELHSYTLRTHGTDVEAKVESLSKDDKNPLYLLGFTIDNQPDWEWTSEVADAPQIGDVIPAVFDPANPSGITDRRLPRHDVEADALAAVCGLIFLALALKFALMSRDDFEGWAKARLGRSRI